MMETDQIQTIAAIAMGIGLVSLLGYLGLFVFSLVRLSGQGAIRFLVAAALAIPILIHIAQPLSNVVLARFVSSTQFAAISIGLSVLWNLLTFVSYGLLVFAVINAGSRSPTSS